jgi:hypothetical protein
MLFAFTTNTIGPLITVQQLLKQGLLGGAGRPSLVANVTSKVGSVDDNRGGGEHGRRSTQPDVNGVPAAQDWLLFASLWGLVTVRCSCWMFQSLVVALKQSDRAASCAVTSMELLHLLVHVSGNACC